MRIVQVIPYFSPVFGGEVDVCFNLSSLLAKQGHEVTIVTSDYRYDEDLAHQLKDVEIIPLRTELRLGLITYTPSVKIWIKENVNRNDVFHLHAFRTYQNIQFVGELVKTKVPYLIQAHGSLPIMSGGNIPKKIFDRFWGRKSLLMADSCIALNDLEKLQYMKFGLNPDKVQIVPNGIDFEKYQPLPERGIIRDELGIKQDTKVVLFLGRINAIKGIDLLIHAFALLIKRIRNVKLLIIGPDDGYLDQTLRLIDSLGIRDQVVFGGYLGDKRKVISAYVDSDLFVLPSIYDMFPTTVLEAWACAKPVIVSEESGIASEAKGAGLVVRRNPTDWCEAMLRILEDDTLSEMMGIEGMKFVKERFSWKTISNRFVDIYQETTKFTDRSA